MSSGFFHADPNQVAAQCLGHIQAGTNIAETVRSVIVVERDIGVGRYHRDLELGCFDDGPHLLQLVERCLHATGTGSHADGVVASVGCNFDNRFEGEVQPGFTGRFDNPNRQG